MLRTKATWRRKVGDQALESDFERAMMHRG